MLYTTQDYLLNVTTFCLRHGTTAEKDQIGHILRHIDVDLSIKSLCMAKRVLSKDNVAILKRWLQGSDISEASGLREGKERRRMFPQTIHCKSNSNEGNSGHKIK